MEDFETVESPTAWKVRQFIRDDVVLRIRSLISDGSLSTLRRSLGFLLDRLMKI